MAASKWLVHNRLKGHNQGGGGGGGTAVLTPSDFTYVEKMVLAGYAPSFPAAEIRFGFTNGILSGRRVGSDIHLFVDQGNDANGGVAEVKYIPGTEALNITNWGDVTKGQRVTGHGGSSPIRGLLWDTVASQLWWAYGDIYNSGSPDWDPSIGTSTLTGSDNTGVTAYGPWRTTELSQKTRGYLMQIPSSVQSLIGGKRFAVGSAQTAGNIVSPYGAMMAAFTPPSNGTAANTTGNTTAAITTQNLIYSDNADRASRPVTVKECGWTHYGEPGAGGHEPQNNPVQDGSGCSVDGDKCGAFLNAGSSLYYDIDFFTSAVWIDGPSKQGICYFGQICDTLAGGTYPDGFAHKWYGPTQGPGSTLCPHGRNGAAYSQSTGDSTDDQRSVMSIWDPATIISVANGSITASAAKNLATTSLYDLSLLSGSQIPSRATAQYAYGGAWFEPVSKLLFISELNQDNPHLRNNAYANEAQPVVHVFSVNC